MDQRQYQQQGGYQQSPYTQHQQSPYVQQQPPPAYNNQQQQPQQQGYNGQYNGQQQQYNNGQYTPQQQHRPLTEGQYQNQQYNNYQQTMQQPAASRQTQDASLHRWFQAVDTDGSGSLSCEELQRALTNGDWTPFNVETIRMMMNMFDRDNSGSINYEEFVGLWNYIEKWKQCFMTYDVDRSGTISEMELQKALFDFGYNLAPKTIKLIMIKYDTRGRGDISFDNFVQSCVTVKTLTDSFRRFDVHGTGMVTMNYDTFLSLVINNR